MSSVHIRQPVLILLTMFCFACGSLPEDETGEEDSSANASPNVNEMNTNADDGNVANTDGMADDDISTDMPTDVAGEEDIMVGAGGDEDDEVVDEPSGDGGMVGAGAGGEDGDEDSVVVTGGTAGTDVVSGAGGDGGEDDPMTNGGSEGGMDMEPEGCVVPQGSNSLQTEIQQLINQQCGNCHGSIFPDGLTDITSAICRSSQQVRSMNLIEPGDAQNSYLYHKVANSFMSVGGRGTQMPQGGSWSPDDVDRLAEYINSLGN